MKNKKNKIFELDFNDEKIIESDCINDIFSYIKKWSDDNVHDRDKHVKGYIRMSFMEDNKSVQIDYGSYSSFFYIRKTDGSDINIDDMNFEDYIAPI